MRMCSIVLMVLLVMPVWANDLSGSQLQKFIDSIKKVDLSNKLLSRQDYANFTEFNNYVIRWFSSLKNFEETRTRAPNKKAPMKRWLKSRGCRGHSSKQAKLIAGKRTIRLACGRNKPVDMWWQYIKKARTGIEKAISKQSSLLEFKENIQVQNEVIVLKDFVFKQWHCYTINVKRTEEYESTKYEFAVVNKKQLPSSFQLQAIEKSNKLSVRAKQTFRAFWLATQGNEWVFEAYQLLANMTEYYPALLLKIELENGNRPRFTQQR